MKLLYARPMQPLLPQGPAPISAPPRHASLFRQFLSELNPLQYIPVVGAIYRAVTHDTIPDTVREAGSLVVSFLTGGPAGVAINLGAYAAEQATGIDPEALTQRALASIGIGGGPAAPSVGAPSVGAPSLGAPSLGAPSLGPAQALPAARDVAASSPRQIWSHAQLAAYGVTRAANGELRLGALAGSDVLNALELSRLPSSAQV